MTLREPPVAAQAVRLIGATLLGLGVASAALAQPHSPATAGAAPSPRIGEHELMLITDDNGSVLDVIEYVYVGVNGAQLSTSSPVGQSPMAALRVGHAGLPLAQSDLNDLTAAAVNEAALLNQVQQGLSGLDSALPSLPAAYALSADVATVAEYQAAFQQLHAAYVEAGLDDVEAHVRDLDQNGLSDVLLDVLHSGLTPPDYVEFWETFDAQPFFDGLDTAEGDFDTLLDALILNEQEFSQLLTARGFTLSSFLERLAERQLPPAYLLSDAVAYAADPGAFIDWVMAKGDDTAAVSHVPLTPEAIAQAPSGQQNQAMKSSSEIAWQVLGEMGKIGAPVSLIARMKGQGLDPHADHQPAMDGGLQPLGGKLDPSAPGKPGSWSYDVKVYRLSPAGSRLISDVALDLDATACAQYNGIGSAPGQFARDWQLYLGIANGDPEIILSPSQQANRGSYLGGRDTGNPADVLQVSLERIPLAIAPRIGLDADQPDEWGGGHTHQVDLVITGDGWTYMLNAVAPDDDGELPAANLSRLAATRIELQCNPRRGVLAGEQGPNPGLVQTPKDAKRLPPRHDPRLAGASSAPKELPLTSKEATAVAKDSADQNHAETPDYLRFAEGELLAHRPPEQFSTELAAAYYKGRQFYFMYLAENYHQSKRLVAYPAEIDTAGRVTGTTGDAIEITSFENLVRRRPEHLTATVARGCVYLAWSMPVPEGDGDEAWMKWSCDDGSQWFPKEGPQRIGPIPGNARSMALSSYTEPMAADQDPIVWLTLFYTTDFDPAHIGVWANSGAAWVRGQSYRRPWGHGEWHSLAALNVTGSEGDESVLVAATTSGDGAGADKYLLRMQTYNGTWHTRGCYVPLEWTRHDGELAMAAGTLWPPSEQNTRMIQIFGMNAGRKPDLRHFEFSLLGKNSEGGCLFGPVDSDFPTRWASPPPFTNKKPLSISAVPGFRPTPFGIQQYITVAAGMPFYKSPEKTGTTIVTATYQSDRYVMKESNPVDTGPGDLESRSAWTLLGVIEGVPPFTRNGVDSERPLSRVRYGESRSQQLSFQLDYSFELTLGLGVGGETRGELSTEVTYGVNKKNSTTQRFVADYYHEFANTDANHDGRYGYLLFAQPRLKNYRYEWWSATQTHKFGTINQLFVDKVAVRSERYLLSGDGIFPGLPKRWPTSSPRLWQSNLRPYEGIPTASPERIILECDMNPSVYSEAGGCGFEKAQSRTSEVSQKWALKLTREIKAALKFSLTGKTSVDVTNTVQTSRTQRGEASVHRMPVPAPDHPDPIGKIVMTGYWIEADHKTDERPYWVPDQFQFQRPWLFTYRINNIEDYDPGRLSENSD